jgi:hypothetical protein
MFNALIKLCFLFAAHIHSYWSKSSCILVARNQSHVHCACRGTGYMALVSDAAYTIESNANRSIPSTIVCTNRKLLFVCTLFAFCVHLLLLVSFAFRLLAPKFKGSSTSSSVSADTCEQATSGQPACLTRSLLPNCWYQELSGFWRLLPIKLAPSHSMWFRFHLCMLCMQIAWFSGAIYTSFPSAFDLSESHSLSSQLDSSSSSSFFFSSSSSSSASSHDNHRSTWFRNQSGLSVSSEGQASDWNDWWSNHLHSAVVQFDATCLSVLNAIQLWLRSQSIDSITANRSIEQTRCLLVGATLHYFMLSACFCLLLHTIRLHWTLCGCPSLVIRFRSLGSLLTSIRLRPSLVPNSSRWTCTRFAQRLWRHNSLLNHCSPRSPSTRLGALFTSYRHRSFGSIRRCFGVNRRTSDRAAPIDRTNSPIESISRSADASIARQISSGSMSIMSSGGGANEGHSSASPSKQCCTRRPTLRSILTAFVCTLIRLALHALCWLIPALVVIYAVVQNPNDFETRR